MDLLFSHCTNFRYLPRRADERKRSTWIVWRKEWTVWPLTWKSTRLNAPTWKLTIQASYHTLELWGNNWPKNKLIPLKWNWLSIRSTTTSNSSKLSKFGISSATTFQTIEWVNRTLKMQEYKASKRQYVQYILKIWFKDSTLGTLFLVKKYVSCDWKRGNFGFMEEVYFSFIKHTGSKNTNMDFFNS